MTLKFKQSIDNLFGSFLVFVNLILAKVLGFILRRNHKLDKPPDTILIIKILGLGSIILASDAIYALKGKYRATKLVLLCGSGLKTGVLDLELFDEIWELKDKTFFQFLSSVTGYLFKTWRIRNLWIVDLEVYSKLTTIFSLWTCAINRFGFELKPVSFRHNLNTHNVYFNQFCNVEDNYNRLAEEMGAEVTSKFFFPKFFPSGRKDEYKKEYIAINNTCSELAPERKCPDKTLMNVCEWIIKNTDYKIALLGAPYDKIEVQNFVENNLKHLPHNRIYNVAGKFSFTEYYEFLYKNCVLMLTIDSAPLHIAKKLGVPTVSLWGPTNPETRITVDERNLTYYLSVRCSPCTHYIDVLPCGGNNFCMKDMSAEHISFLVQRVIHSLKNS